MRTIHFICALLVAAATVLFAQGADLTKIDRTIAKEPAYKGKPKYCLLVLGPEAKFRVWLVIDGDTLYVDRNGNGDLTEPGDITEPDRGTKHIALSVKTQRDGMIAVSIMTEGKFRQASGPLMFAGRPRDAPIIHFNGPVSVRFASAVADTDRGQVEAPAAAVDPKERLLLQLNKNFHLPGERRQTKAVSLSAIMGTPGLGEGTFATYKARDILANERLAVEAAFPNQDAKPKPILVKGFL